MSGQLRLVMIDDDEVDRLAVERALRPMKASYLIEGFASAEAGFERLLSGPADCVLLDYSLPGCNGIELLARLREAEIDLPVIMLTGVGDEELVTEALHRGADDYLAKAQLDGELLTDKIRTAQRLFAARRRAQVAEDELHRLVERLREAVRARDSVLAVVSHDLRGPLNNIELAVNLLTQPVSTQQRQLAIDSVRRAVQRSDRLINDLLEISQIRGGGLELTRRRVDAVELVETTLRDLQPALAAREISVELRRDDALVPVFADPGRLMQVLDNLVRNAIKYGPRGGQVSVELRQRSDAVEFSVRDEGPGLDADDLEHVFERFWQGQERASTSGSGLGLAIAKGLVEAHGGLIGVALPEAGGARFWFTIPVASGDPADAM